MPIETLIARTQEQRAQCFAIRRAVFVQEHNVPLDLEMDEYDDAATHFLLWEDGAPLATARLLDKHGSAKIGRVAVLPGARGRGLGLALMETVLNEAHRQGFRHAVLDAQTYAIPFYARLGFVAEGGEFDDAGIPHRLMRRALP